MKIRVRTSKYLLLLHNNSIWTKSCSTAKIVHKYFTNPIQDLKFYLSASLISSTSLTSLQRWVWGCPTLLSQYGDFYVDWYSFFERIPHFSSHILKEERNRLYLWTAAKVIMIESNLKFFQIWSSNFWHYLCPIRIHVFETFLWNH